jgi:RND family efflux transporter MFP subunit
MIAFLLICYAVLLFLLVRFKIVPWNTFWKVSPLIVLLLLTVLLFIPMSWGAPSGPVLIVRPSVQIIPNVAGEVIDVPVIANTPLKENDVLFRIDPALYDAQVRQIEAQLKLAELRLDQMTQLQKRDATSLFNVQEREAEVSQLRAQLDSAKWNLDKTVVRAPANGYVTNLALRKGARVSSSPTMAFIDTSDTAVGIEIPQVFARYIESGQPVEATFKFLPGEIYTGKVEAVLQATSQGQVAPSGQAVTPTQVQSTPFVVRIALDDREIVQRLPAGSTGTAAIFTEEVKVAHIIQRVILRQTAILNYVLP